MSKEKTPTDKLHERFREELRKPLKERYFSEDDLINVFDTAGDYNDDYFRYEALLMGARLYPESIPLLERRAIHYLDNDSEMFVRFMEDYADVSSPMMSLLRLNLLAGHPYDGIVENVETFLSSFSFKEDEEVIQFVQTLHSLGLDRWLVENLERLKTLVPYLPSLLYEYGFLADESDALAEVAVSVLEQLTELEPYTADYWTLLAVAYSRDGRADDAVSAIEYALAIDPDNAHALKAKMHLSNIISDPKAFAETVRHLQSVVPDDQETAFLAMMTIEKPNELYDYIDSLSPMARSSRTLVMHAVATEYPRMSKLLEDLYDYGVRDAADWRGLAEYAYQYSNFGAVNDIMRVYEEKSGGALQHDYLMFSIMFDLGNYPLAANIFVEGDAESTIRDTNNLLPAYSKFIIALLRMNDFETARSTAESLLEVLKNENELNNSAIEQQAMRNHLEEILKKLNGKRAVDWNKFKPIG